MDKKLNKFRLKRLVLLVFALVGIVLQAEATDTHHYCATMNVHAVSEGNGTVYVGETGTNTSQTLEASSSGGEVEFTLRATAVTGYQFGGWYSDAGLTNKFSSVANTTRNVRAGTNDNKDNIYHNIDYHSYAKFVSADTWTEDLISGATYTVTTEGDRFRVTCDNTNSFNHNLTFLYVGNITANSGTATINFNNTQPLKVNGLFKVKGSATLTLKKTNNNNNVTLIRKDRTGNLFEIAASGRLNVNGYSSSAMFIVDGGTVFGTEYDARTPMTTTGATGKMFYVLGHLTMQDAILQNGNGICINANSSSTDNTKYEMKLDNVKIRGFYAQEGAAVYLQSQDYHNAVFTNVTISGCNSHAADDGLGGTIRTNGGVRSTLTLDNCTIEHCYSGGHGGGVYWNAAGIPGETKIIIRNNTKIQKNEAKTMGGGIFVESEMELESVIIDKNKADQGGGIFLSTYQGGAEQFSGDGYSLYVTENVEITNNTAWSSGGGAYMYIQKSDDIGFNPAGNPIDATFQLVMSGGKISGNHAPVGAGVSINDCAPKKYKVSDILSGTYIRKVKISGGEIKDNICTNTKDNVKGAGIYIRKYEDPTIGYSAVGGAGLMEVSISGGNICSNIARNDNGNGVGGGFYINNEMSQEAPYYSECTIKIDGTVHVSGNECDGNGAGLYVENGDIDITGGIVGENGLPNISHQGNGAGVYVGNGKITISKGNVDYNQARYSNGKGGYGGAFYLTGGTATISGGSVSHNIAHKDGGGFFVNAPSSSSVTTIQGGATVASNEAVNGAGVFVSQGQVTITGDGTNITSNIASNNGGGLFTNNGTIAISNQAKLSSNAATNGAGLYSGGGEINVTGKSKLDGNTATGNGGAVYITNGTVTISDGTIGDENADYGNTAAVGGGIYAGGGTITVKEAGKVLGNTATSNGGGIYANSGNITVKGDGTKISYNSAADGGGLFANSGSITIDDKAELSHNTANNGAGLYAAGGDLTVQGQGNLNHNIAENNGGGVYSVKGLTFHNATMDSNEAKNGGGVYVEDDLELTSATIKNNKATDNGGGVYLSEGTVILDDMTVKSNQATNGAGLYINNGSIVMTGGSITDNIASQDGGGSFSNGDLTLEGGTELKGNQADNGNGGAFYVANGTTTVKQGNTIDGNFAKNGAGAYVSGTLNLTRSSIINNIASDNGNGGGVYSASGTTTLTEMTVNGNRAGTGGGFYVSDGGSIAMIGGSIATNKAINGDGGGIYTKGDFTFQSGAIDHNEARQNGGGVYAAGGTLSISTGNVTNNTAAKGGGIYAKSGVSMSGGLIAHNTADKGGGLYAEQGTSTLTDGDIQANVAYDGGGIYIYRNATLNLYKSVRVTGNTCGDVTSGLGGGIYQDGTLNVAGTEVKVSGNVKENPNNHVQTPNNVYLVGEYGSGNGTDDHFTCINIVNWTDTVTHFTYHGLQENVDIGINVDAVPHAVIHSDSPDDPGHLTDLYIKLRDHAEDALLKDDLGKYQAIYADAPLPYNHNDIFFTGTWQAFAYPEGVTVFKDTDRAEDHDVYFGNISTEQRLAEFMCYVNGLNGYTRHPNQNGQVTRDLYMSAYIWLPIGSEDGNNPYPDGKPLPYSGHFDGGGHIINGLTSIGLLGMTTYGLFGHTAEATISNTFVTECLYRSNVTETLDTYDTIGGIVGKMVGGKLYYSESGGTLFSNGNHSIMGGLVGYAENAEIHSCMAMPAMECGEGGIMGGLVGKMYAKDRDLNYGYCRVMNCFANPMFTTTATTAIGGGLVGVMDTYSLTYNHCQVTESYVRLDRKHSFPETFATNKGIAALVGDMSNNSNTTSMNNVYLPEPGHCGVPGYSYVLPHRITSTGSISNYATYRAVSDPGVYAYDPAQDTRIDVIQQGVIPCPDEPQLLPQLLKQAVDRNYAQAEEDRPVPPICYWKRTGANSFLASGENINGDYPILDFDSVSPICGKTYAPAYIALGSKDGLTMDYCVSLSDMIRRYNDYEGGGAINLFHNADVSGPDDFKATDNDVRLYIDEGITVLQGEGGYLNAVSYQTLRYGHVDYWHTFSSVMGPRTTSLGTKGESRIGFNYGITGEVAYDYDNGNPCNVTLDHGTDPTDPNSNYSLFPYDTKLDSLDLYSFYEPQYHWINFKRNSNSHWHMDGPWEKIEYENEEYLIPGKGYLVALHPQPVLDSEDNPVFDGQGYQVYNAKKIYEYGILNCGNVTSGTRKEDLVTYTIQASGRGYPGYNLLGNPYQAYLNLDAFAKENMGLWSGERDLDTTFYMYDAEQNAYLGYKYGTEPSEGNIMPSKWIAPHQGFFVVKSTDAPTSVKFIETGAGGMAHLTGDGGLLRGENDKPACRLVNLVMKDEAGHADVASIEFGRQKQGGLPKQQALRSGEAIIYTSYQDKDYAMLLLEEDVKSLPLHFECTEGGTYTLSWNTANGQFVRLVLVDNLTGVSTDCLSHDSYTFEARPDDYKSRFKLVFHYDFDEEEESESHISNFAFINGGDLIVNGQGIMEIIDMNGHVIVRTRLTDNQSRVSIPEVAAGVYVIRLNEKSQKIVIWK